MSAFEVYKDYVALKNHFTKPEYDYFKYNGKSRLKLDSFNKRKDKIFFEKLAKNKEYHKYLIANFSVNQNLWIRDITYSDNGERIYKEWLKKQQSLAYMFKNDLNKLSPQFDDNLTCNDGQHPKLLKLYLGGEIMLETVCIILDLTNAIKHWNSHMEYDPVWDEYKLKIVKYTPFILYDKEKFKKIILDFFSEYEYNK